MALLGSWPSLNPVAFRPWSRPLTPMAAKRSKVYAVQVGRRPGLYRTWDECRQQTEGFPGAKFKSFSCENVAKEFLAAAAGLMARRREERCAPNPTAVELDDLNDEQKAVLDAVLKGHNVFITGPPGAGKSFLLRRIIQVLRSHRSDKAIAVCASTGVAAVHVNGSTFHSFLGCGLGSKEQWEKAKSKKEVRKRLRQTEVLILDEVSMLSGDFLDMASSLVSYVRGQQGAPGPPFGGLQVVLCGDFMQLPPVQADTLAFQAKVWEELKLDHFNLRSNFRQAEDVDFQGFLQQLRLGKLSLERFRSSVAAQESEPEGIAEYPKIVSTNSEVEAVNSKRITSLPGEEHVFQAQDEMEKRSPAVKAALNNLLVPEELRLKVGCVVMLLINLRPPSRCKPLEEARPGQQDGPRQIPLVNGSIGRVVAFEEGFPVVQFARGYRRLVKPHTFDGEAGHSGRYSRQQLPLKVAWAMTIHKTQGLTLDSGELDLSKVFDPAQLYVALSRFRSLERVKVSGLPSCLPAPTRSTRLALEFHERLERISSS